MWPLHLNVGQNLQISGATGLSSYVPSVVMTVGQGNSTVGDKWRFYGGYTPEFVMGGGGCIMRLLFMTWKCIHVIPKVCQTKKIN